MNKTVEQIKEILETETKKALSTCTDQEIYLALLKMVEKESEARKLSLIHICPGGKAVGLFSGMIFCGDCGASMVRKTVPAGEKKYVYYICSAHKQDKSCSPHRIRDITLEEIVLDSLKQHISEVVDMSELLEITDTAPLRTAQAQKVQRQLDKKHEEYEKLQKLLMSLYENLADDIIDREEYTRLKASFTVRADEGEKQMEMCIRDSRQHCTIFRSTIRNILRTA